MSVQAETRVPSISLAEFKAKCDELVASERCQRLVAELANDKTVRRGIAAIMRTSTSADRLEKTLDLIHGPLIEAISRSGDPELVEYKTVIAGELGAHVADRVAATAPTRSNKDELQRRAEWLRDAVSFGTPTYRRFADVRVNHRDTPVRARPRERRSARSSSGRSSRSSSGASRDGPGDPDPDPDPDPVARRRAGVCVWRQDVA